MKFLDTIFFVIYRFLLKRAHGDESFKGRFLGSSSGFVGNLILLNLVTIVVLMPLSMNVCCVLTFLLFIIVSVFTDRRYSSGYDEKVITTYSKRDNPEIKDYPLAVIYIILTPIVLFISAFIAIGLKLHKW